MVLSACGGATDTTATGAAAEGSGASDTAAAPGLVAETTTGGQFAFNDLEGKPALLWFWAPW